MRTQKQMEASRRNGVDSTHHGLTAQTVVLNDECRERYMRRAYHHAFQSLLGLRNLNLRNEPKEPLA